MHFTAVPYRIRACSYACLLPYPIVSVLVCMHFYCRTLSYRCLFVCIFTAVPYRINACSFAFLLPYPIVSVLVRMRFYCRTLSYWCLFVCTFAAAPYRISACLYANELYVIYKHPRGPPFYMWNSLAFYMTFERTPENENPLQHIIHQNPSNLQASSRVCFSSVRQWNANMWNLIVFYMEFERSPKK